MSCFLYCSTFPRNTQINWEYLVHAWIVEAFVSNHQELGDRYNVGCYYVNDLISCCISKVSKVDGDG